MLFSSQVFLLLFLPLAVLFYYRVAAHLQLRLWYLIAISAIFYAWWDWRFLPLLLISVAVNWWFVARTRRMNAASARALMITGVCLNLGLLGFFKYTNFALGSFAWLATREFEGFDIVLPLGISFFTFQQVSYLIDRKRGNAPVYGFAEYAAYVMFFPQLIAGPIVRHNQLVPQFADSPLRDGLHERLGRGFVLFVLGLTKKVFFSDELGAIADPLFDSGIAPQLGDAWLGALAYSFQLYFDFSAYSDMAIGLGLMFGFRLPQNFQQPYRATTVRDFWRRWHMTLSEFLRDYVYIPLGGSRAGGITLVIAALATMLLCGLWHGAGWTFVVWGGLHGVAVLVNRLWARLRLPLPATIAWFLTMLFVVFGWVLFRSPDFGSALQFMQGMLGMNGASEVADKDEVRLVLIAAVFAIAGATNVELALRPWVVRRYVAVSCALLYLICTLRVGAGRTVEFIYFQF